MTKIRNTGPGGPAPTQGPETIDQIKDTNKTSDAARIAPQSESTPERQIQPDRSAAADLKAAGSQIKSHLESQLQSQKADTKAPDAKKQAIADESLSPEQLANMAAQTQRRFAPPYVPVGPVVRSDNIAVPEHTTASAETTEMRLRADQFQINEQGNLVITNEKLIDYFKSLQESGQDILLNITNRKAPGDE